MSDFHQDVLSNAGSKIIFRTNFPESRRVAGFLRARQGLNLVAAIEQLSAAGIEDFHTRDHGATHSVYLRDPDGNRVELYIDVQPETWRDNPALVGTTGPLAL